MIKKKIKKNDIKNKNEFILSSKASQYMIFAWLYSIFLATLIARIFGKTFTLELFDLIIINLVLTIVIGLEIYNMR